MNQPLSDTQFSRRARRLRLLISDIDGVLTDGGMYFDPVGRELKRFNVRDGINIHLLRQVGIRFGAITGEKLDLIAARMKKLGADFLYMGIANKRACIEQLMEQERLTADQIAYVGDEINDLVLIDHVGLFLCPADANPVIRDRADHVIPVAGGSGVLRAVVKLLLEARGQFDQAVTGFIEHSLSRRDDEYVNCMDSTTRDPNEG